MLVKRGVFLLRRLGGAWRGLCLFLCVRRAWGTRGLLGTRRCLPLCKARRRLRARMNGRSPVRVRRLVEYIVHLRESLIQLLLG